MYLYDLRVLHFKNWEEGQFTFSPRLNCFVGPNGSGKTNILDAIYYLSLTKSYFSSTDLQNIQDGADFFVSEGTFYLGEEPVHIHCALKRGQKKVVRRDKVEYDKLADHIGQFPSVVISPYDRDLITEGSETRRRFMDSVISQSDAHYLHHLLRYQRALRQRNTLLKQMARQQYHDAEGLELYDEQMAQEALPVVQKRSTFIQQLLPRLQHYYQLISDGAEEASLDYKSKLRDQDFRELLQQQVERDRQQQFTSVGIHRDDLDFTLQGRSVKKFGSQGQQKSFLIALKLAQYDFLKQQQGRPPLLLLDDIFDKLDEDRVAQLIQLVHDQDFGQIFITDTHPQRTQELVRRIDPEARFFQTEKAHYEKQQ